MKALPKKLVPLTLFAIAVTSLFSVQPGQAYTITLQEMGPNVVANGNGPINLNGLIFVVATTNPPYIYGAAGKIITGPTGAANDIYTGFTGPTSFGIGSQITADIGSGDMVGIDGLFHSFVVPGGYVSGDLLSSSATWNNATFASLGVTPGIYVWSWGDGANQKFTLIIGAGVPDGGSTVCLLGCALLGLVALRRKLSC